MAEIEETRRHKAEEQQRRREEARLRKKQLAGDDMDMEMDVDGEESEEESDEEAMSEDSESEDEGLAVSLPFLTELGTLSDRILGRKCYGCPSCFRKSTRNGIRGYTRR